MTAHRVSLLRSSLRRYPDPTRSADPRVRELVGQLAALPIAPPPDSRFRAELRAQLVAITPRIVAEGAADTGVESAVDASKAPARSASPASVPPTGGPRHAGREGRPRRVLALGRGLKIATCALTVLVLLIGGAVWLSRNALPGDALYGVKRAAENVELATASSDTDKANDYLGFARTRADEVQALMNRSSDSGLGSRPGAAGRVDHRTTSLILDTLGSSDSDVRDAATLLGNAAVRQHSQSPLADMTRWAPGQIARLHAIWTSMPLGTLRNHAAASKALVTAALHRADALSSVRPSAWQACMSAAGSDSLGPTVSTACPTQPASNGSAQHSTGAAGRHTGHSGSSTPTSGGTGTGRGAAPGGGAGKVSGGAPASPTPKLPPPSLPKLPLPTVTPPKVSVGSCGISVSAGSLNIGLGSCPTHK